MAGEAIAVERALRHAGMSPDAARSILLAARLSGAPALTPSDIATIARHTAPEVAVSDLAFNEADFITLGASAVNSVVIAWTPPPNTLGILRWVATGVGTRADFDSITWRLRVGGSAINGFDAIQGPIASIIVPLPIFWPIFKGQKVDVIATNRSATAITNVTALVRGTFFPSP